MAGRALEVGIGLVPSFFIFFQGKKGSQRQLLYIIDYIYTIDAMRKLGDPIASSFTGNISNVHNLFNFCCNADCHRSWDSQVLFANIDSQVENQ